MDPSQVSISSFANYSQAIVANGTNTIDYSAQPLSSDIGKLYSCAVKLAQVAGYIEESYDGVPQDIEGALTDAGDGEYNITLVQTRPQV